MTTAVSLIHTRAHTHTQYKDSCRYSFSAQGSVRQAENSIIDWLKKNIISPYMVRERCRRIHCRMTPPQVRSGDWGRRTRWLQPLLWNPPLTLKAPGGSSAHTPRGKFSIWMTLYILFDLITVIELLSVFVCLYLKVSQQTETGRWSAGTEQLLIGVPLYLWTHPEGLKHTLLINLFSWWDVWNSILSRFTWQAFLCLNRPVSRVRISFVRKQK